MRLYITLFFLTLAPSLFASNFAEVFTKGFQYYSKGDYQSALEMFKQIPESDTQLFALSAYYMGSIYAFEGKREAFETLKKAVEKSPDIKTRQMAFNQYARLCIANKEYQDIVDVVAKLANDDLPRGGYFSSWEDSENAFNIAVADFYTGHSTEARKILDAMLLANFSKPEAIGVDMFISACKAGSSNSMYLVASLITRKDILALKSRLQNINATALARFEILLDKNISQPQKEVSFFAQIILAEQNSSAIDKSFFEEEIYKNRNVPFAWRGSLALGKIYFAEKNYAKAMLCAKDCIKLSSPEIMSSWRGIMLLADSLRLMKKYDSARQEYQKIYMNRKTKGEPIAEALYKTGLCFFEQGQWVDAHVCFERVFVAFFRYEYWGSRAYYYDAQALYSMGERRDAKATLVEYFNRAKDRNNSIYKLAKKYYDEI